MAARRRAGSFSPKTSCRLRVSKVDMLDDMACQELFLDCASRSRLDATELQLKVPFDVDLEEPRQQSGARHLLERLAVARIRRVRQKDDAPEVQRRLLRPTDSVSDMKEGLKGTGYKSDDATSIHL